MSDRDSNAPNDDEEIKEQDRYLPIANVARIMKRALPENAKIAKDAKECVQECVSEFISFITSEASDRCQNEKRKTINGEDILWAMQSLGFENYCDTLKLYLHKYRETTKLERANTNSKDQDPGDGHSQSVAQLQMFHSQQLAQQQQYVQFT
ncbi:Nuclear transcription factor Y subunit B-10 [Quaeritorhiza haematococci]|nr:Nuclear transcription factor Y subunit B-10 [Quaeritorhiza haematococci]